MLLSRCETYEFLPNFAKNDFTAALCAAMDALIKEINARCGALPCENSYNSLMSCRDDELAHLAAELGSVPYYPDLPKATRCKILQNHALWTRGAGTVEAIKDMVGYVFGVDGEVTVNDDIDQEKFPCRYEIIIHDEDFTGSELNIKRFGECVGTLGRAATTPMDMRFSYTTHISQAAAVVAPGYIYRYEAKL